MPSGGRRCALLGPEGPREGLAHDVLATDIDTMRVDDRDAVLHTFADFRPELVLHGGAITAVDRCETEADAAFAVNAVGTRHVAEAAAVVGAHVVYVSTDYVFDGTADRPYREWDAPAPGLGVRRVEAGGGAGVPTRVDDRAHQLAVRGPRCQHRRHRAGSGRRGGRVALRRRPTRLAHLHGRSGSGDRHSRAGSQAGHLPRHERRHHDVVGPRAGSAGRGRRGSRARAPHRHGGAPSAPARPRGRRTRCSTTWRCASAGFPRCRTWQDGLSRLVSALRSNQYRALT